ncbi:amidohydrolase family protein [Candidatus Poribacteria bacterium]|nr:amidohydrolase family protein [Candidatus Poribacteria bacterium]MYA56499.1 amidohydrolase family protein [Candidatus Poribacteria bacterium]
MQPFFLVTNRFSGIIKNMKFNGRTLFNNIPTEIVLTDRRVQTIREVDAVNSEVWIAPALIDIQVNGFAGFDLNVPTVTSEDVSSMVRALWRVGTGFLCPTVVTGSFEGIGNSLRAILKACEVDSRVAHSVLGIHLEGPYISAEDGPRGAHPLEHVREPDWDEFQRWQDIAEGQISIVTLAPEKKGAIPFIGKLIANGVVVALGHTAAAADDIRAAIDAGARLSTHLGNGAHALIRRHPNYIWEQLGADELWASLIVDGHHLPSTVAKSMIRAKTLDRCLLVSDAVALAGMQPGIYQFAGKSVELTTERCVRLVGTEYLAGSAIELARGIENSVRFAGISLKEAVSLATLQPMRLLDAKRRVAAHTNLILFEWDTAQCELNLLATIIGDELVYHSEARSMEEN